MSNLFLQNHPDYTSTLVHNEGKNYSLVIEPLYPGYGHTIGNSLRRILLSSIPGFGITKIRINDVTHEYQAVDGIVEDALEMILNIKNIRPVILSGDERITLTLNKTTAGPVVAGDFNLAGKAKIANPDSYICTLNKGAKLEIEIEVCAGVGYTSMDDVELAESRDVRQILVDTTFSPVTNVMLDIDQVRVGDKTNYDKLTLNFDIDGTVNAVDVINYTLDILIEIVTKSKSKLVVGDKSSLVASKKEILVSSKVVKTAKAEVASDIDLPEKIKNILAKNNIHTNDQLKNNIAEVADFSGIGAKAIEDIKKYIKTVK